MSTLSLQASDGHRLDAYLATPAGPSRGTLVVLQEIFGVNSHIRSVADSFAAEGWTAIAPALFDRVERNVQLGYAPPDVERGRTLKAGCDNDTAMLDVAAALAHHKGPGPLAVVGYCWGGTLAWLAACGHDGLSAAVAYYGGGIGESLGLTPRCPVMAHFGDKDAGIPLTMVDALRHAHPEVEVHVYPAGHGFNCDQRGAFEPKSATLARERTAAFLTAHQGA